MRHYQLALALPLLLVLGQPSGDRTVFEMTPAEAMDFIRSGPREARQAFDQVADRVRKLPVSEREALFAASTALYEACPYSRATHAVVTTLRYELNRLAVPSACGAHDQASSDPLQAAVVRQEALLKELALQAGAHETLFASLRFGPVSDAEADSPARGALESAAILSTVRERVSGMDRATKDVVGRANKTLGEDTAGLWNFNVSFIVHRRAELTRLAEVSDEVLAAYAEHPDQQNPVLLQAKERSFLLHKRAGLLIELLNSFVALGC